MKGLPENPKIAMVSGIGLMLLTGIKSLKLLWKNLNFLLVN